MADAKHIDLAQVLQEELFRTVFERVTEKLVTEAVEAFKVEVEKAVCDELEKMVISDVEHVRDMVNMLDKVNVKVVWDGGPNDA